MGRSIEAAAITARTAAPRAGAFTPGATRAATPPTQRSAPGCACGGGCPRCSPRTAAGLRLQARRALGDGADALERQADQAADEPAASSRMQPQRPAPAPAGAPEAPASVEQVLGASASPLEPGLRGDMEQRFARDFSAVRVHRGAAAEQSAAEIGALAYTAGSAIVFGRGQYAPHSATGRRLIAHELAHVVQQGGTQGPVQRDLAAPYRRDAVVTPLTPAQVDQAIEFNAGLFGLSSTMALVRDVIAPADTSDRALITAVGRWQAWHGLAQDGRLNPDTLTSIAAELTAAQAKLLRMAADPAIAPQLLQTVASATLTTGADGLDTLPAATRARVQAVTASVVLDRAEIERMFRPPGEGAAKLVRYTEMNKLFGPGIPENAKASLSSMAGYLMAFDATLANGSKTKALPTDATINVEMSLWPYINLAGLFRFTRIAPDPADKDKRRDTLIIELLTALPPLNEKMPPLVPALAGAFSVGGTGFVAGAGWRQDTSGVLRAALGLLPPAALAAAAGLTFVQDGASSSDEAGLYDPDTDTVRIHANAFRVSNLRVGKSTEPVAVIAHEIGHALDLRPMMVANPDGSRSAQTRARSLSGTTWIDSTTQANTVEPGNLTSATLDTAFRQAVNADAQARRATGLQAGVTDYGETDWQEAFSEAFMLYTTDAALLRSIRPATFAYFSRRYPR